MALALLEFATDWIGVGYYFWSNAIINLAHGEFIMLGAYTTFVLQSNFKLDLVLTIPCFFGNCNHWSYYGNYCDSASLWPSVGNPTTWG